MNKHIKKSVLFAILLSIGYFLPFLTIQIKEIGQALSPMHLPVLIAGFILGPIYGGALGLILPLTRSLIFGMPILYPSAIAMAFELLTYGLVSGLLFKLFKRVKLNLILNVFISLIVAMIIGRFVYMIAMIIIGIYPFSITAFKLMFTATVINSIPGIIVQLILIPSLVVVLFKTNVYKKICED